jgi:uncharacterized protein
MAAITMTQLEDLYLPYRPKRRTLATIARDQGLAPLALELLKQSPSLHVWKEASKFITGLHSLSSWHSYDSL